MDGMQTSGARAPGNDLAALRGAGKQTAKQAGGSTVQAFFDANKAAIAAMLPRHMDADRMLKIALRCLRVTPKLMNCTLESFFGAVITCAQMGLEPNTPQGHVYLIPFENKRAQRTDVQVVIGYKGLIDLARRSGEIESISARVIYSADEYEVSYGTEDSIKHKPFMGPEEKRGYIVGFYAVAKLKDGGVQFEFMSNGQVESIRNASQGYKSAISFKKTDNPWQTHYVEMGRKTLIRRLAKYLPMSIELANAVALDERADMGAAQGMEKVLDGEWTVQADDAPGDDDGDDGRQSQQGTDVRQVTQDTQVDALAGLNQRQQEREPVETVRERLPEEGHNGVSQGNVQVSGHAQDARSAESLVDVARATQGQVDRAPDQSAPAGGRKRLFDGIE